MHCFKCGLDHKITECPGSQGTNQKFKYAKEKSNIAKENEFSFFQDDSSKIEPFTEIRDIQLGFPVPLVSSNLSMPAFVESLSEEFVLSSSNELEFVADTGSTSHVLTNVEDVMQSSLIPLTTSLYFADGRSVRVTHKGDVNYFVKDCLVAPEFKFNLLSISKLADIGYTTSFSEDSMTIRDQKNNIIATGFKKRNLYFVKIARSEVGLVADVSDIKQAPSAIQTAGVTLNLAEKWHARLGHLCFRSIEAMNAKGLLPEKIPTSHFKTAKDCIFCSMGKAKALPFPKVSQTKAKFALELVSGDLCGPILPPSLKGHRFLVLFVEHFSSVLVPYFIVTKDQAPEAYLKAETELIIYASCAKEDVQGNNLTIKNFRTDNDSVFLSKTFQDYLKEKKILHHLTVPGSSAQNGLAERSIGTVVSAARTVLSSSPLPQSYWPLAVLYVCKIKNTTPSSRNENFVSPMIKLTKGSYNSNIMMRFRPFGCLCYVLQKVARGNKFDMRSEPCIFVGYPIEHSKGFRVLLPFDDCKIFTRRHVHFDETRMLTQMDFKSMTSGEQIYRFSSDPIPVPAEVVIPMAPVERKEMKTIPKPVAPNTRAMRSAGASSISLGDLPSPDESFLDIILHLQV